MNMTKHLKIVVILMALAIVISPSIAAADFPAHSIRIIVPYAPGGSADATGRTIARFAEEVAGVPMAIENRAGGGGVLGQTAGALAAPDGYTLTVVTSSITTHPLLTKTAYTWKSFAPIIQVVYEPDFLVAQNDPAFNTMESYLEYAKANPDAIRIGNSGPNTSDSITAKDFEATAGIQVTHVPFDGGALATAALMGGHIESLIGNLSEFEAGVEAGDLSLLCTFQKERSEYAPEVPTCREKGLDVLSGSWRGIAAPAGTPQEVIDKLHSIFKQAFEMQAYRDQMDKLGIPVLYGNPADFTETIRRHAEKMEKFLVKN